MRDLTTGKEGRVILGFAWPMLLGNVFQQLYSVVDSIVVGNFLGKEALSAVGASFPIIFSLISLIVGLSIGFNVVISQYFGAKNIPMVRKTIDTMNIMLIVASVIITTVGLIFNHDIFRLINLPPDIMPQATEYLDVYFIGIFFFFGFNGVAAILRGLGDSKTPLVFLVVATLLNIVLDLVFIVVMGWGVGSAAWATIISQGLVFLYSVYYLNKNHKLIQIKFRSLSYDSYIMKKTLAIGLPTGIQQTFVSLGMLALQGIVNKFGTNVIAAYSAVSRLDSFASLPAMTLSAALSTFVGQNLGAGKIDRIRKGYVSTLKFTMLITITMSLLIVIFPEALMRIFNPEQGVISEGVKYLHIVSFFYLFFTLMFVNNGLLRGAGDTLIPMFITVFSLWVIRIPIAWYLSGIFGPVGIWWSIPLAWLFGMTFSYIYYLTGRWKTKGVVGRSVEP
ncbi:MAG: MATE family efflux transporter [Bacteroidetes bacterium HGW-Bacteroidetes-21]|jgi:putative MATE family efflux protein|nr:MAG: MATE family efflux transporter [Bacteroidetes bacterium HGW-Bacteroidetes-21]